ncbi:classical arabinogalactan protein 26 [Coffea arabica]|uniref:Classical arabinogalactan protein 26 n=1 Tax=Coffea arabica TaxID=13443 RepID=A0A6P6V5N7_COFAR|nr:classical arabinogalactan protein 26-like [Coffea arabica]
MAAIWPLFIQFLIFMASPSLMLAFVSTTLPDQPQLSTSTISAAPALLPDAPLASPPALSPDITPLFPSPGGSELSPSESSLPTIPSSPSPPNPDAIEAPVPFLAFSPLGSLPFSSSNQLKVSGFLSSALLPAFLALW